MRERERERERKGRERKERGERESFSNPFFLWCQEKKV